MEGDFLPFESIIKDLNNKFLFDVSAESTLSLERRIEKLSFYIKRDKYKAKEKEIISIKDFFIQVFNKYPSIITFSWHNINCNEIFSTELDRFLINNEIEIIGETPLEKLNFGLWKNKKSIDFTFFSNEYNFYNPNDFKLWLKVTPEEWKKHQTIIQDNLQSLKEPVNAIIVFLTSLYNLFGAYYFIHLFGLKKVVQISKNGISITNS